VTTSAQNPVLLIPHDGTSLADTALALSRQLAAPQTKFVLLRVVEPGSIGAGAGEQARDAVILSALEASATNLGEGAEVDYLTVEGDAATVIADEAARLGASAIVLATQGRGAIGRWLHGSVADRVARVSTVPVVIARGGEEETPSLEIRRVLVPYDGSELAMTAVPVAAGIATTRRVPVHVLTAVDVTSLAPVSVPGAVMPVAGEMYEQVYDDLLAEAQKGVDQVTGIVRQYGAEATSEVRIGPAIVAIEDVMRDGDLVVLTSHGRSGIQRWLLGSVAEQLVRTAPVPVMLVPAAGRERATA
jgi:nucleotide-binding universal stress UspA family protein